jgi:RHH-type proline utilization regulon transcriptional repressor/proline dehydrogenase/delta 1-pyrroline-5-carboxylate dehydrogenase
VSIANYAYWAKKFSRDEDASKLIGQDNLLCYRPHKKMALRFEAHDDPFDALRALAAALTCKTELFISCDPQFQCSLPRAKIEENAAFAKRAGQFERIRLISPPSEALLKAASETGCYLDSEPVLASGRLELLHYLHEIALCVDYHRYGNLGLREGEIRSEIL